MEVNIQGKPAFAHLKVTLQPGESILAESDAMLEMQPQLSFKTGFNGGFLRAVVRKFFGGESLFINTFKNETSTPLQVAFTQGIPGDIYELELNNESFCLQNGAYIASEPSVKLGVKWAGLGSFIGREGLFKLVVSGKGKVYFGSYGGIVEKTIHGELIVDSGHLIAYDPNMKLKATLPAGIITSIFSGEGLVTRVEGNGKLFIQTRSFSGLASWVNRHL